MPPVFGILGREDLVEPDPPPRPTPPGDLTRDPLAFPAPRDVRLQALARGDEGFLLAMGYSTQRGWGGTHPFVGETPRRRGRGRDRPRPSSASRSASATCC